MARNLSHRTRPAPGLRDRWDVASRRSLTGMWDGGGPARPAVARCGIDYRNSGAFVDVGPYHPRRSSRLAWASAASSSRARSSWCVGRSWVVIVPRSVPLRRRCAGCCWRRYVRVVGGGVAVRAAAGRVDRRVAGPARIVWAEAGNSACRRQVLCRGWSVRRSGHRRAPPTAGTAVQDCGSEQPAR